MLAETNYYQHAHRLPGEVSESVIEVQAGQLFQKDAEGKWEYADGTKKAYPTNNARYRAEGTGRGLQGEKLHGWDDITDTGMMNVFKGNYEIGTDQYDKDVSYVAGQPLHASTDPAKKGLITAYDAANPKHKAYFIIGYVTEVPAEDTDMLRYEG